MKIIIKLCYGFNFLVLIVFQNYTYAACIEDDVVALAKGFYTSHRDFYANPLQVKSLIESDFFSILENEYKCASQGELCAIEADPWLSAQDGEIKEPISFVVTTQAPLGASVKMSYFFVLSESQKESLEVVLQFKQLKRGSCWLLEDFIAPKEGSLKKYIRAWQLKHGKTRQPS